MTWFALALLSAFFFTFYDILARVLAIKSENPRAFAVVYNFLAGTIALLFWLFENRPFAMINTSVLILTFMAFILWGGFNRVEYYAHKYMEASLRTIIFRVAPLTTIFAAALFLKETVTPSKIFAATLILGGNIFALYKRDRNISSKGLIYSLITAIFLGLAWTMDKKASVFYPTSFYAFLTYSIPTLFFVLLLPPLSFKVIQREFLRATWKVVLLALINVLGYYCLIKSFAFGEASKAILILDSKTIFTILAGIVVLGERTDVLKKILAGVIVTAGVLLLK